MYTNFGSLNTSLQALHSMQQSIQTSSHNIANANTPGYSRQKAVLTTGIPYSVPAMNNYTPFGQVGTGVVIDHMQRFRDSYLDSQIRGETLNRDAWEVRRDTLQYAEVVWNEPSDTSINSKMSDFWTGWSNVATTPDEVATRTNLLGSADALATTISDTYRQFTDLRDELDSQVGRHVASINDLAQEIASLNERIRDVEGIGQQANDLRDQRDLLFTELSGYVKVDIHEGQNGTTMVSLGGKLLVMDQVASQLQVQPDSTNGMLSQVVWADTGQVAKVNGITLDGAGISAANPDQLGGKLGGTLVARDFIVPNQMNMLDQMADALRNQVNTLHTGGFDLNGNAGVAFFTGVSGDGAQNFAVNSAIAANPNLVAAASNAADVPGDGTNALAIARLIDAKVMNGGTANIDEYYQSGIAQLGQDARQAVLMTENQDLLVQHLEEQQEQVSGVSLDEETANLLQYQHTYQAAARVMTTVDGMLETIINKMGLVGR
jgi:flagellar hook-associated protein 1 FlgK